MYLNIFMIVKNILEFSIKGVYYAIINANKDL